LAHKTFRAGDLPQEFGSLMKRGFVATFYRTLIDYTINILYLQVFFSTFFIFLVGLFIFSVLFSVSVE